MVLDPFTGALITGGLTLAQGALGFGAKQQEHANNLARQKASDEFAAWSASNQARTADLNNSYAYWQQKINYGQELAYANQARNYELSKSINQAELVARVRASAGASYASESQALVDNFSQQSMADAVSLMQYKQQALRSAASVTAAGQEGANVDRYVNDYARQVGDMTTMQQLNQQFRDRQFTRESAGQIATYLNRYNSQQLYEEQQVFDPIAPFPPLATLVNPAGPSFTGAAPNAGTAFLGSALGAVSAGMSTYTSLSGIANSGNKGGG
jgi:hypothetical protein